MPSCSHSYSPDWPFNFIGKYYVYTHKLALLLAVFSLSNTGCMNISASSCLDKTLDSDNIGKTVQVDRLI